MILSHTSPKDDAFVYLRGFYNSERNTFIYLLEEMTQKRAFSVDLPSRFHRGAFIVTGGGVIGYYRGVINPYVLNYHYFEFKDIYLRRMCVINKENP